MADSEGFALEFNRYYDCEELTYTLKELAAAYPGLATLQSIGKSFRGRDVWLLEVTNKANGEPGTKPGYYIDAVTHAEEVSGSLVALYTAWYLLTQYGTDEMVTRLLDWQTFYIVPVVNPDGMEICLKDAFYEWIGNGRYRPGEDQVGEGLHYADVNGDGIIVDMRIRDEKGEWKVSDKDARIMVHREPYEYGGEYYRLLPEGYVDAFDGAEIPIPRPMDGNLNRNYPYRWGPENEQYGAGEYPLSEPEILAVTQFILAHQNIVGALNYHTNAGAILLPFETGEGGMPFEDQAVFRRLGDMGAETTGYGLIADEKDFNLPNVPRRLGTSGGLLYVQLGVLAVVTELWDVYTESGIQKDWFFPIRPLSEEESLKLLKWSDEQLDGEGYVDWTPFEHPQLGEVEIGGWRRLFMFRNPPGRRLKEMCHKNALFTLRHALMAPRLHVLDVTITPLANDLFRVEAVIENLGYLPTHVTRQAINAEAVSPVVAELRLEEGVELVAGKGQVELGHLAGRSERAMNYSRFIDWHACARKAEWVVRLRDGDLADIEVQAISQRAGRDAKRLSLRRGG
jgi:murein tripeptide amidase MpaA